MNPLDFDKIKSLHEQAKQSGNPLGQYDLKGFSSVMQQHDTENDWSAGQLPDNLITKASRGIDSGLEKSGVRDLGRSVGGGFGGLIDSVTGSQTGEYEQLGRKYGADLPRQGAGIGLTVGGLALAPFSGGTSTGGTVLGLSMLGLGAADAGMKVYTDSGSAGAGVGAAALTALAPWTGKLASGLGTGALKAVAPALAESPVARFVASEIAQESAFFGVGAAQTALEGGDPFSKENLFGQALGTVAFAPVTLPQGVAAFREGQAIRAKRLRTPAAAQPKGEIIPVGGINPQGELRDVPVNDTRKLFDFLSGNADSAIKSEFEKGNVKGALESTGMLDPDIANALETSNRRYRGRHFVEKLAENNDVTAWQANERLFGKAAKLLQVPETDVRDMVQRIAMVNAFERKFKAGESFEPQNLTVRPGFDDAARQNELFQRMAQGAGEAKELNAAFAEGESMAAMRTEFNSLPNRRARELAEQSQPEGDVPYDPNTRQFEPLEFQPAPPKRMRPLEFQEAPDMTVGRRPASVKGKVDPNALSERLSRPEYSRMEFDLFDKNGEITSDTANNQYRKNLSLDGDPERAMLRLDMQIRGALKSKMKDSRPDVFVQDGLSVASRAFDEMGIDSGAKESWLQATSNVLKTMSVFEGTRVRSMDDLVKAGLVDPDDGRRSYGVYLEGMHHVGMNTKSVQATPELGAFHFVKTLGHESYHALTHLVRQDIQMGIDSPRTKAYQGVMEFADSTTPADREGLIRQLQMAVLPSDFIKADAIKDDRLGGNARYASSTSDEFAAEYAGLLAMSVSQPQGASKVRETLRWAPQAIQNFANAIFRTMDELRQITLSAARFLGFDNGRVQELNRFQENLKTLLTPDPEVVKAREVLDGVAQPFRILNGDVNLFEAKYSKVGSPEVEDYMNNFKPASAFERRYLTVQQLVNSLKYRNAIPGASRVMDAVTQLGASIKQKSNVMRSHLMVVGDGGALKELAEVNDKHLTPKQVILKGNFAKVEKSHALRVGLAEIQLKVNELVRDTNDNITFDRPEILELAKRFTPEEQGALRAVFDAQVESNRNAAGMIKTAFLDRTALDLARIYKGAGVKHTDAQKLAWDLLNNVAVHKEVPKELRDLPGSENAVAFWESIKPAYDELNSMLDRPHFSELRTGRYQLTYTKPDGVTGRVAANNELELKGLQRELKKRGYELGRVEDNQNKEFNEFDAVPTAVAESMIRLEQARFDAALNKVDPEVAQKLREEYTLGQALSEEVNKRKQFLAERKYSEGRELIDMYSNQGAYLEVVAASTTKKITRNQVAWEMESEDWNRDLDLKKEVETFVHDILTTRNTSSLLANYKKGTLAVAMGANVSGAMMDASQSLMVGALKISETMGLAQAYKTVKKGYLEAFNPKNKEFQAVLARAQNDGLLQSGYAFSDTFTLNDVAGYNVARAGDRRNLVNLEEALTSHDFMAGKVFDLVKQMGGVVFNGLMIPTKASGQLNNKVMLYAGMVEGQKLGLTGEALYKHAVHVSMTTNFQGGRAAQSTFKTKFGQANGLVEAATLLTNYSISVISQMYGNFKSSLKSSGLSPEKRNHARKVFAAQLMIQFGMAGTLGLGLGPMFKLAEKIFGFSPEEEIRKGLATMDESGTLADIMLRGVANKATGVDFASRFSLSGIMGLNDYSGFDSKGLLGPSVGLWEGLANLPADAEAGHLEKSALMPNGLRKMFEATTPGPFTDKNGQALIDPTTTERIIKFIGFKPETLAQVQQQRSLYRQADLDVQRDNQLKTAERMKLLEGGKFNEVLLSLKEDLAPEVEAWRAQGFSTAQINKLTEKELRSKALNLVKQTVQKSHPLDPLSEGSAASSSRRRAIAASLGDNLVQRNPTVDQMQMAAQLLQGLGQAAVKRTPKSIQRSRLVDQLVAQDPTLTEQDAALLADQMIP
jgi:hypothetical protein